MAISDKPLFAIGEGPSARGKPGECMNELRYECLPDQQVSMNFGKERVMSEPDFTRLWLTLITIFFNTQNRVYSRKYALFGSDLSACAAPDNVKMEDNVKTEMAAFFNAVKSEDVDRFEERSAVDFDLSECPRWLSGLTTSNWVSNVFQNEISTIWNMNLFYRGIITTFITVATTGTICSPNRRNTSIFCTCMINISCQ
jgi:hypothetical protein